MKDEVKYLVENMWVEMVMQGDERVGVEVGKSVEVEVVETEGGIKGDRR